MSRLTYKTRDELEAELEELKARTCEGCKHLENNQCGVVPYFVNSPDMAYVSKEEFSCNKWEAKDE